MSNDVYLITLTCWSMEINKWYKLWKGSRYALWFNFLWQLNLTKVALQGSGYTDMSCAHAFEWEASSMFEEELNVYARHWHQKLEKKSIIWFCLLYFRLSNMRNNFVWSLHVSKERKPECCQTKTSICRPEIVVQNVQKS